MDKAPFQSGDIVYLKSGSPKLTVAAMDRSGTLVHVSWFAGAEHRYASLKAAALTRTRARPEPQEKAECPEEMPMPMQMDSLQITVRGSCGNDEPFDLEWNGENCLLAVTENIEYQHLENGEQAQNQVPLGRHLILHARK